ncbi:TIGR00266 family protein [Hespellia stercorisuis]|uniref:TIGR00266 family protein n=1 Tax=Hespellia stercorisuis DSM 15480 TaxID=1121950 RepID=A0A1M6PBY9_9FIRM|nr:TIGR00266 family protein [Hespellia stercorisuis]SHK05463.1 TIGR00266 family protein [Hespellia stercorisuis DSM 15480]
MQYEVKGGSFPAVVCTCSPGEKLVCESGAMSWMSPNMKMDTNTNGGIGKAFGRMFSGESIFLNSYEATDGEGMIAFASSFPGDIRVVQVEPGREVVLQKKAFLAGESSVQLSIFFQKKFGSGLFGGEGFIMEKVSGSGLVFVEIDGSAVEYDLAAGQSLVVDTGYVAMMDATCSMDIKKVPGVKNMLLGGEGIFNTVITGPGKVTIQTMPICNVAGSIIPYIPSK